MKKKLKPDAREDGQVLRGLCSSCALLVAAVLICVFVAALPAVAGKKKPKPPRTVRGIVVDGSENPIIGAVVQMTDVQTGKKLATYTQAGGQYQFSGLDQDHDYKVQASYHGVESQTRTASSFDTRNTIRLNLQIPPPKDEQDKGQ